MTRPASCWALPCPYCAAPAGDACRNARGVAIVAGATHGARWSAWTKAKEGR